MMINRVWSPILSLIGVFFLTACAAQYTPLKPFTSQPIEKGRYDTKAAHLVFILDASSSMANGHQGHQKIEIARAVINNFNATMPDSDIKVSLRSFGHDGSVSSKNVATQLSAQPYERKALSSAVDQVSTAGGTSPLDAAIVDTAAAYKGMRSPIAVVIVSDGEDMGSNPVAATKQFKADHGDKLCIYTVQVGNAPDGTALLREIAAVSGCGKLVNANDLASGSAMNQFVKDVVLAEKMDSDGDGVPDSADRCPNTPRGTKVDAKGCALDSDNDGVTDDKDKCPNTPAGTKVDAKGCPIPVATKSAEVTDAGTWLYKDIQFENNKADLRQSSFETLNEISAALKAQPGLAIEIQGHTDSRGARSYNLNLSRKRAQSVKKYLESKGIDSGRMTTRGYGPDRPIAGNATREGRAKNRRVEIKPLK